MKKKINWKNKKIDFECCEKCGIGVGVTKYPDREFRHQEKHLTEGLCSTCYKEKMREVN